MTSIEFNRRLFSIVLWVCSGLALLLLLTSCAPYDPYASLYAQPVTATPSHTATLSPTPQTTQPAGYIVTSDALEIRTGPSETALNVGYLKRGQIVTVYETAQAEQEYCTTWAKIAPSLDRWVCLKHLKG